MSTGVVHDGSVSCSQALVSFKYDPSGIRFFDEVVAVIRENAGGAGGDLLDAAAIVHEADRRARH